jgi:A/G-specific adenine glycosylase
VRGRLLDVLRASDGPVAKADLDDAWEDPVSDPGQRERCLASLRDDGLVTVQDGRYRL